MNKHNSGFTLIELMVTVAIIAILASIALPSYSDYITRGKIPTATTGLSSLRAQMEQYYQDNRNYGAGACGVLTLPTSSTFTFTCTVGGTNQSFTATATGNASMNGFIYTIDELGNQVTTGLPNAGWGTAPINCWVTKKGGVC